MGDGGLEGGNVTGGEVVARVMEAAQKRAGKWEDGHTWANSRTKKLHHEEWNMGVDEAMRAEAEVQAS